MSKHIISPTIVRSVFWKYLSGDTIVMSKHGIGDVTGTRVELKQNQATRARYNFQLQRKPQYVVINIILPILFLNLLNVLVFMLPTESGELAPYSLTVLLSIAVFMTIVSDISPRTSKATPHISPLLLISFL